MGWRGFSMLIAQRKTHSIPPYAQQIWANWSSFGQILGMKIQGIDPVGPRLGTSAPSILKPIIAVPSRSMATAGLTDHWLSGAARSLASVGSVARDGERKTTGWAIWDNIAPPLMMMWRHPHARSSRQKHLKPIYRRSLLQKTYWEGSRCAAPSPRDGCAEYFASTVSLMSVLPVKCVQLRNNFKL